MPFFSAEHHRIHYVTAGDCQNPPLLFLHGFLGSHQDFLPLLSTFSHHFYCIVPDLPGHGETQTNFNSYTFARTADSLLLLLNHLNIQQTHLLGYSMGGRLALYLTCEFPDCFVRVVLESASPGLKTVAAREDRCVRDEAIAHTLKTIPLSDFLEQWYQNPLFASLHGYPQIYAGMLQRRQQNCRSSLAQALIGLGTGCQPSVWQALPSLHTPFLLVVGALDCKFVLINRDMATRLTASPAAKLNVIEDCGHNIHLESPEAFSQAAVEFLLI